jgi:uncharacterized protein (TIGR02145 family)
MDSGGLTDADSSQVSVGNTSPNASFTVTPASGTTVTVFAVDASGSTDNEDLTSVLEVRWDWENDGTCDTDWTTIKTASHQYATPGTNVIKLEVKDTEGLTDTATQEITVSFTCGDLVTDIDGNTYPTVQIGHHCWMAENLKVTHYRNGDPIRNVTDNEEWANMYAGAYCSYNNDSSNVATYGRLYNWYAVDDSRNIAPKGWHVPSDEEWKDLETYLGMSWSEADAQGWRGTDEGGKMKEAGTLHWQSPNTGATDESGFSALPSGARGPYGDFFSLYLYTAFWSSTESGDDAWHRGLKNTYSEVLRHDVPKRDGFSIRCSRD